MLGAAVILGGCYVGCSFPKYTYDDNAFYDASTSSGGTSGGGASSGGNKNDGSAGTDASTGGKAGSGGSAATGGGGAGGTEGGTAGNGGSAGGPGGAGGGTNGEICNNGIDDNGDNLVDCADPACANAGYLCQSFPSGWDGPVALYTGDYANSPPACNVTGNYPSLLFTEYLDPSVPAQCQCSCGTPTGVKCGAPKAYLYSGASCSGNGLILDFTNNGSGKPFNPGDCITFSQPADAGAFTSKSGNVPTPIPASGGSCAASTVVVTKPEPWKKKASACGAPSAGWKAGGCGGSSICVPPAPKGFNHGTCIYQTGDVSCPSPSVFSTKVVLYSKTTANDTRGCTPCACDAPSGNCSGKVNLYTSGGCSGSGGTALDLAGTCTPFTSTSTLSADYQIDANQSGVSCAVSSGAAQPTGSVTPQNPTTFCCTN